MLHAEVRERRSEQHRRDVAGREEGGVQRAGDVAGERELLLGGGHELRLAGAGRIPARLLLVEALGLGNAQAAFQQPAEAIMPTGKLDPVSIAHALCAGIPENGIVVDESLTSGRESMSYTLGARPHDMINNLGGSIGYSPPVATGAALASAKAASDASSRSSETVRCAVGSARRSSAT